MTGNIGPQYGMPVAYSPAKIAEQVESAGVAKAAMPVGKLAMLGLLAGAFIGFGAAWYTVTMTGGEAGYGPGRMLGGLAFSLGLVLVVIAGAELFTGNNLIVMAWADRKVSTVLLLRNWGVVYVANFVGAVGMAGLIGLSGILQQADGAVAETALRIAAAKVALPFEQAFFRGVACNALVCLAIWLAMAARTVVGKSIAIVFPVTAFVALGFEHSIANMYFIPLAMMQPGNAITVAQLFGNLAPVTLGNIVGGGGFVALAYWMIYLRKEAR